MTPEERLDELARGENPKMIARLPSGFAVMGDSQYLEGYCLLLAYPLIGQLNNLTGQARAQFLADMARLGDAVKAVTGAARINYSIYGNLDPFLHAHVFPRFETEDAAHRNVPPFLIPATLREAAERQWSAERHGPLQERIRLELARLTTA